MSVWAALLGALTVIGGPAPAPADIPAYSQDMPLYVSQGCPDAGPNGSEPPLRPGESPEALRRRIWDDRQEAQAICLFLGVPMWVEADIDTARKLHLIGSLRSRYEHSLCESWPAGEASSFYAGMRFMSGAALARKAPPTEAEGERLIDEVLDWPGLFDYEPTMLGPLCQDAGGVRPKDEWPTIAKALLDTPRMPDQRR